MRVKKIKYFFGNYIKSIKYFIFPVILILFILLINEIAYSSEFVSVSYLLKNVHEMNGKDIYLKGEVIGQIIGKGEYKWINVLDIEGNAIGIWASKVELDKIKYLGKYNIKGDTAVISGIFNKSCLLHDGEVDIHANNIDIEKLGYIEKEKQIPFYKIIILIILLTISAFIFVIRKILKNKS